MTFPGGLIILKTTAFLAVFYTYTSGLKSTAKLDMYAGIGDSRGICRLYVISAGLWIAWAFGQV